MCNERQLGPAIATCVAIAAMIAVGSAADASGVWQAGAAVERRPGGTLQKATALVRVRLVPPASRSSRVLPPLPSPQRRAPAAPDGVCPLDAAWIVAAPAPHHQHRLVPVATRASAGRAGADDPGWPAGDRRLPPAVEGAFYHEANGPPGVPRLLARRHA